MVGPPDGVLVQSGAPRTAFPLTGDYDLGVFETSAGAQLALFPELVVTGYPPEDLVLKPAFQTDAMEAVEATRPVSRVAGCTPMSEKMLYVACWIRSSPTA